MPSKLFGMKVWVFSGGEEPEGLPESSGGGGGADLAIAADGGLWWAQKLGVQVDAVVGDMDSVEGAALAEAEAGGAEIVRHDPDKDATDLELALGLACERGASSITLRPLASETLPLGTSRGISNQKTGTQASVSLESCTLLVIKNS